MRASFLPLLFVIVCLGTPFSGGAGTFFCDFNSGVPTAAAVFGTAIVDTKGGIGNSGVLKLTQPRVSELGSFVLNSLDGKSRVASFVVTFKGYIGGGNGADGLAFHYGSNVPNAPFADANFGGLSVIFDTYKNSSEVAPGIRLSSPKGPRPQVAVPELRTDRFVDVLIKLDPDGTVDVGYDNEIVLTNVATSAANAVGARYGFGARTGSRTDNHFIDDLKIVTQTTPRPYVDTFAPTGNDVGTVPFVDIVVRPFNSKAGLVKVKDGSVQLNMDGVIVQPDVTLSESGETTIHYESTEAFEPGSKHLVTVKFTDTATPEITSEFSYGFRITSQVYLSR